MGTFVKKIKGQQESPPARTQEAYRPPRSNCSLCWGGRGGTPSSHGGGGGTQGTPHHLDLAGGIPQVPPQTWDGVPPPVKTWDGVPPHPDLGWGTPMSRPGMGYPPSRPGMGYPPDLRWDTPPDLGWSTPPQIWDRVPPQT